VALAAARCPIPQIGLLAEPVAGVIPSRISEIEVATGTSSQTGRRELLIVEHMSVHHQSRPLR